MYTRFTAAKHSCINILQAEANREDGVQQARQIISLQKLKDQKRTVQGFLDKDEKMLT